ncbi:MAG: acyltransferase, partial [Betaproteobacteria bacterium]|nr:acyltransferase [Betaproteobacteria bacterium]
VACHLPYFLRWERWDGYSLDVLGHLGVAIFFVHTSLVLMLSLERHGSAAGPFFVRRFFRIYPLAVVMVLYVAAGKLLQREPVDWWAVLSNILLVQNITGHPSTLTQLWSLPFEVQMYLFLPALFVLARHGLRRVALLWAGSVALAVAAWRWNDQLLQFFPCFLPGVIAYVLGKRVKPAFSPAILFAAVACAALAIPTLVAGGASEMPLLWALCAALGVLIPLCRPIGRGVLARGAHTVATYSYGIYLTHVAAMSFSFFVLRDWPLAVQLAAFAAVLALFSYEAYRWIERPGIDLGIRLADQIAGAPKRETVKPIGSAVQ